MSENGPLGEIPDYYRNKLQKSIDLENELRQEMRRIEESLRKEIDILKYELKKAREELKIYLCDGF